MAKRLTKTIGKLGGIFVERNMAYADEINGLGNFKRNAEYNRVFRIKEIIETTYGVSIHYTIQKIDRLINAIIRSTKVATERGMAGYPKGYQKAMVDSIDDAIVYLFITKMNLIEAGLVDEEE